MKTKTMRTAAKPRATRAARTVKKRPPHKRAKQWNAKDYPKTVRSVDRKYGEQ